MALLHYDLARYDEALVAINKSLLADPNLVSAFETRADIYQQMKNYDKAKADYTNAITLVSDDKSISDLYFDRSYKLEWKTLDYKSALDDLNKSIALDAKDGMKFWHRAITYDYKKDYPKAIADCGKAIQLYGDKAASGLYTLRASLKEKTGDIKGAVSDYQAALKLDNSSASIYYNLGRLFKTKLKNDDLAQINLAKAMEMSKEDGTSSTYAYAKVVNGETQEAVSFVLEKVEKYKDDNYQYKWQLHNAACIYALSGNKVKALEYLDKSLAAGYDDYSHLVNDRDLISLTVLPQYKTILAKYKVPQPKW
jgi:tetratricopeptide (TPR) repeat protein